MICTTHMPGARGGMRHHTGIGTQTWVLCKAGSHQANPSGLGVSFCRDWVWKVRQATSSVALTPIRQSSVGFSLKEQKKDAERCQIARRPLPSGFLLCTSAILCLGASVLRVGSYTLWTPSWVAWVPTWLAGEVSKAPPSMVLCFLLWPAQRTKAGFQECTGIQAT